MASEVSSRMPKLIFFSRFLVFLEQRGKACTLFLGFRKHPPQRKSREATENSLSVIIQTKIQEMRRRRKRYIIILKQTEDQSYKKNLIVNWHLISTHSPSASSLRKSARVMPFCRTIRNGPFMTRTAPWVSTCLSNLGRRM